MSINISEENPTQSSGGADKAQKQAKQLAYDVRYKVRQKMGGKKTDAASLKRAYLQQLAQSPSPGPVKRLAKKMLIGEQYDFVDIDSNLDSARSNVIRKVFVEKNIEECEEEIDEEKAVKKYQIRVTDKKSGKVYTRMADRGKIGELRKSGNVSSVEMTGYGYDKTKKKAKKDFDGDGKVESPKAEYKGSKDKAIKKAIAKEGYQKDPEKLKKDKTHSKQPDPSKDGFTGIGNMSIKDIMKMNKKMKKEEVEVVDEANKAERIGDKYSDRKLAHPRLQVGKRASKKNTMTARSTADVGQRNRNRFDKRHGGDGSRKLNKFGSDYQTDSSSKDGLRSTSSDHAQKQRRAEHEARRGKKTKGVKEEVKSLSDTIRDIVFNKEHHQTDAKGKVIEHGDGTPSSVEEAKKKGLDGKECWDGYKLAGTKKKGGKTVDDCVKVGEDAEYGYDKEGNSLNPKDKKKKEEQEDPRSMGTKYRNIKNRLRSMGIKFVGEEFVGEVVDKTIVSDGDKKIDVMKGKNKIKINPNVGEQVEVEKEDPSIEKKQQRVSMMKRQILQKKMQAVRSGAGADIVAHTEQEGDMVEGVKRPSELKARAKLEALLKRKEDLKKKQKVVEGIGDAVKKGVKRHKDAVEKKKIKNRKAVPYAALAAEHEPEGEVVEEVGCETKKVENKGKNKIDPEKNPVVEAKVDKGRSDYGKATIRNWRHSGPSTVEPAMFDPENKRGKTIDKRREEHKARRGVKTKSVKEGVIKEEDKAFNYVLAKLKKKHGDGVLTKRDKIKPQSAADKAKVRAHQAKVDAENAAERKKDPSQGRYPKG